MLIKLKWLNNNDASAVVQVFRSTVVIDTANPGAPIATLPGNAITYDDNTAVVGTKYYYAVSVSKGTKKLWTPVKTFINEYRRGPGSSRLLYGDERLGYMGKLTVDDFLDVCKVLGLAADLSVAYRSLVWHKFIRKGKIVYVADRPLGDNTSSAFRVWAHGVRRDTGVISGLTWNFNNSAWPDAAKTAIAEKNGDRFHFRVLRSLPDDWDGSPATAAMVQNPETEFNELIAPLMAGEVYLPNRIGCVRGGAQGPVTMSGILCAEVQGGNYLTRGMQPLGSTQSSFWTNVGTLGRNKDQFFTYFFRAPTATSPANDPRTWDLIWPAFELID
jgi:hypothetical protein